MWRLQIMHITVSGFHHFYVRVLPTVMRSPLISMQTDGYFTTRHGAEQLFAVLHRNKWNMFYLLLEAAILF